jgi:hypothetical protein
MDFTSLSQWYLPGQVGAGRIAFYGGVLGTQRESGGLLSAVPDGTS